MEFTETCCAVALLLRLKAKEKRRKKQFWVHPICSQRLIKGQFHKIHLDMKNHPKKFFKFYRITVSSFEELLNMIGPRIVYKDTNWRKSISPEERLSVTLRFLASGDSFNSLHFQYLLGASTIRKIVKETCKVIWECLQPLYMPEKSEKDWIDISAQFYERTKFPNCIGAMDGKHIKLKKSISNGPESNNNKNMSISLLGVVDADGCFTAIDVEAYDAYSDFNVLKKTKFYQSLNKSELNLPNPQRLPLDDMGDPMPFVLIGDEKFALSQNVLRPYPRKIQSVEQRVYNYRLMRAHRMVEYTFGMLTNKWKIFNRQLEVNIDFAYFIIKSCCVLHNFIKKKEGIQLDDEIYKCPLQSPYSIGTRASKYGLKIRDYFSKYFITPEGSIQLQYDEK